MRLPVAMISVARHSHFPTWRSFVDWRNCWEVMIDNVIVDKARLLKQAGVVGGSKYLARLKGGLRRMQVADADEYDIDEYTDAVIFVQEAVGNVVDTYSWHHKTEQNMW
eukprot:CAMPEP_0117656338 /NCGR_PEP_ID=MMETSP0804-20121206/4752_1 /TAXON_ID=1074897 /ORGANISM="Tetraselmis astigmatica, Strain CCMP880" /LENGTH=108 /DNA_ID=CAMNT_0005462735 /DNA_START=20 /DNA_END=343 /DNA_ORIENTATION=+